MSSTTACKPHVPRRRLWAGGSPVGGSGGTLNVTLFAQDDTASSGISAIEAHRGQLSVFQLESTFNAMLKELKMINFQLMAITGIAIEKYDVEGQ